MTATHQSPASLDALRERMLEIFVRRPEMTRGRTETRGARALTDSAGLVALLAGVPFVHVGAEAQQYFLPEGASSGLAVLLDAADFDKLSASLAASGANLLRANGPKSQWRLSDGQLLTTYAHRATWVQDALQTPLQVQSDAAVASLPTLVLLALAGGAAQDVALLTRLLGRAFELDLQMIEAKVEAHMPQAFTSIRQMATIGRSAYIAPATAA
jgi:hypothetical protein